MAKTKGSSRVNGKNGENIWLEDDLLRYKTSGSVEHMPVEVVESLYVANTEEAREAVNKTDLVPHGAWTKEMPSTGGKSMFLVVKGRANVWVMEITKSQVPHASSFVDSVKPADKDDENRLRIPNRAINTPLGALFTVGSIVCIFVAVFAVYTFRQPLIALLAAAAAIAMYINIK